MNQQELEITEKTTISEAIVILKGIVERIANSEEAAKFHKENPNWSNLFRESYKPFQEAMGQYEEAFKINEWLNEKNPENQKLTLKEIFFKMSDQQKLSLFHKRINSQIPSIFDDYLRVWWMNRY